MQTETSTHFIIAARSDVKLQFANCATETSLMFEVLILWANSYMLKVSESLHFSVCLLLLFCKYS